MEQKQKKLSAVTESSKKDISNDTNIYKAQQTAITGAHRVEWYPNDLKDGIEQYVVYNGPRRMNVVTGVSNTFASAIKAAGIAPLGCKDAKNAPEADKKRNSQARSINHFVKKYPFNQFVAYATNYTTTKEIHVLCFSTENLCEPVMIVVTDEVHKIFGRYEKDNNQCHTEETYKEKINGKLESKKRTVTLSSYKKFWSFASKNKSFSAKQHTPTIEDFYPAADVDALVGKYESELNKGRAIVNAQATEIARLKKLLDEAGIAH